MNLYSIHNPTILNISSDGLPRPPYRKHIAASARHALRARQRTVPPPHATHLPSSLAGTIHRNNSHCRARYLGHCPAPPSLKTPRTTLWGRVHSPATLDPLLAEAEFAGTPWLCDDPTHWPTRPREPRCATGCRWWKLGSRIRIRRAWLCAQPVVLDYLLCAVCGGERVAFCWRMGRMVGVQGHHSAEGAWRSVQELKRDPRPAGEYESGRVSAEEARMVDSVWSRGPDDGSMAYGWIGSCRAWWAGLRLGGVDVGSALQECAGDWGVAIEYWTLVTDNIYLYLILMGNDSCHLLDEQPRYSSMIRTQA